MRLSRRKSFAGLAAAVATLLVPKFAVADSVRRKFPKRASALPMGQAIAREELQTHPVRGNAQPEAGSSDRARLYPALAMLLSFEPVPAPCRDGIKQTTFDTVSPAQFATGVSQTIVVEGISAADFDFSGVNIVESNPGVTWSTPVVVGSTSTTVTVTSTPFKMLGATLPIPASTTTVTVTIVANFGVYCNKSYAGKISYT